MIAVSFFPDSDSYTLSPCITPIVAFVKVRTDKDRGQIRRAPGNRTARPARRRLSGLAVMVEQMYYEQSANPLQGPAAKYVSKTCLSLATHDNSTRRGDDN